MTSIVGLLCEDGAVIATDSAATFVTGPSGQAVTMEQPTEKIDIIANSCIIAGTGQIGLGQRFCQVVEEVWEQRQNVEHFTAIQFATVICQNAMQNFASTAAGKGQYGALMAFPWKGNVELCEFALADFQPELKQHRGLWYASMGSAQTITDPFLGLMRRVYWRDGPPKVPGGIFAACWTLEHAIELNPGGVAAPTRIAVLDGDSPRILTEEELAEHQQSVSGAHKALREFREEQTTGGKPGVELPKPE